jgi:phage shock protein PspC (stress-responsive transcriptional regulator)
VQSGRHPIPHCAALPDDKGMDTTHNTTDTVSNRRLVRPREDRVLGGVAAAIAHHTGASVAFVRLAFLVGALFGGLGVVVYLAAWALIPNSDADSSPAEQWMRNLTTPGKRVGAFLIGIAVLLIVADAAPVTIVAAAALLAGAALLASEQKTSLPAAPPQDPTGAEEPETE